jgi:hypothetical protein
MAPRKHLKGEGMARSSTWSGWISFAGWLMIVIGILGFFEGLIAVIRGQYYVLTASQVIVFDTKTWGWITLLLGIAVALVGFGLLVGEGWARVATIVLLTLYIVEQLAFLGAASFPLWSLTMLVLSVLVLYALFCKWDERVVEG